MYFSGCGSSPRVPNLSRQAGVWRTIEIDTQLTAGDPKRQSIPTPQNGQLPQDRQPRLHHRGHGADADPFSE